MTKLHIGSDPNLMQQVDAFLEADLFEVHFINRNAVHILRLLAQDDGGLVRLL